MPIEVQCEQCGHGHVVRDELSGKRFRCVECGAAVRVQSNTPPTEATPRRKSAGPARNLPKRRKEASRTGKESTGRERRQLPQKTRPVRTDTEREPAAAADLSPGRMGRFVAAGLLLATVVVVAVVLLIPNSPSTEAVPGVPVVAETPSQESPGHSDIDVLQDANADAPDDDTTVPASEDDSDEASTAVIPDVETPAAEDTIVADGNLPSITLKDNDVPADARPDQTVPLGAVVSASAVPSQTTPIGDSDERSVTEKTDAQHVPLASELSDAQKRALQDSVHSIFELNCHGCHGQDGSSEGGMNYVLDFRRLVATDKIIAGNAQESDLFVRIQNGSMPPEGSEPRPTNRDIEQIRRWIQIGAPSAEEPTRDLINQDKIVKFVQEDLRQINERDRRFARYFTISHLYNAGRSEDELQTYRIAIGKLVNSLSWERQLVHPHPIDPAKTVFRVDIRDLRWKTETWDHILSWYPYGFFRRGAAQVEIVESTGTVLPFIRGDWFVWTASKPPLYHDILELPNSLQGLQALLRIDFQQDVAQERVARAGFNESGVSVHPRVIERHETADGACWVSHDFAGSAGERNFFVHPLSFRADGGEIIFNLPNGLQAYFLVDAEGRRLDTGPLSIVKDPGQPDAAVVNGVSCMRCHAEGIIRKRDQVRPNVLANARAFTSQTDAIKALYIDADEFDRFVTVDRERFSGAMNQLGITRLSVSSEPVFNMSRRFEDALDVRLAAGELGLSEADLVQRIGGSTVLQRHLGTLRVPGGTVKRDAFESIFAPVVATLRLGDPISAEFVRHVVSTAPERSAPAPSKSSRTNSASEDWYVIGRSRRWPSYLDPPGRARVSRDGLRIPDRSLIRSTDGTWLSQDFTFEVVFSLSGDDHVGFIGIGEGRSRRAGDEPVDSVNFRLHRPDLSNGDVGLSKAIGSQLLAGRLPTTGPHRAIISKSGDTVTFAIDVDDDGPTPDDIEQIILNINDFAPFLTTKNTHLFFGGSGTYLKLRLSTGSSLRSSAGRNDTATNGHRDASPAGDLSLFNLATVLATKQGLTVRAGTVARTRLGDYLKSDFRFDVTVDIPRDSTRDYIFRPIFIGIGEGNFDRHHEPKHCVRLRMNPPGLGEGTMVLGKTGTDGSLERGTAQTIGQIRNAGTHRVSIVKRGQSLTFAVDVDNDGQSPDDFESSIPDISAFTEFVHIKNSYLFFGGDATFSNIHIVRE